MPILATIAFLAAAAIAILLIRRRASRGSDDEPDALRSRQIARERVVSGARRLRSLEEEIARFAEGSDPGFPERLADRKAEAIALRSSLEADCKRHNLPLGLVLYAHGKRPFTKTPGRDGVHGPPSAHAGP